LAVNRKVRGSYRFLLSPYFRLDPGRKVGSIKLEDISQLPTMGNLVWDHVQEDGTLNEQLQKCAEVLKAASFVAVQALVLVRTDPVVEEVRIVQIP